MYFQMKKYKYLILRMFHNVRFGILFCYMNIAQNFTAQHYKEYTI